ncbi:hypothetical protein MYA_5449 [Burkholderia sp. KJ006]|nr:hypothetical protein MYA_5449 [Burkholderia sp. KJ006]
METPRRRPTPVSLQENTGHRDGKIIATSRRDKPLVKSYRRIESGNPAT